MTPHRPEFRTVHKTRGKTIDPAAISTRIPKSPDIFDSIYVKDYLKAKETKASADLNGEKLHLDKSPQQKGARKAFDIKRRRKIPERSQ